MLILPTRYPASAQRPDAASEQAAARAPLLTHPCRPTDLPRQQRPDALGEQVAERALHLWRRVPARDQPRELLEERRQVAPERVCLQGRQRAQRGHLRARRPPDGGWTCARTQHT